MSRLVRVYMRSRPGPMAQYDGHVDVREPEDGDVFMAAVRRLRATSFPDRTADCWRMVRYEYIGVQP